MRGGSFFVDNMQVIKKINNNFAVCIDNNGKHVIASGKGIGFPKIPYEITDLSRIDRTFYDIDPKYVELIRELPESVIRFSAQLVDIARSELQYEMNPNVVLTLADHIQFTLQRAKEKIFVQMPVIYEVEQSYPKEAKLGRYAVKQMERRFHTELNPNEASGIALHFVNSRYNAKADVKLSTSLQKKYDQILEDTVEIIEDQMKLMVNRESFNFARYSSHLKYLLDRIEQKELLHGDIRKMYQATREEFTEYAACVDLLDEYFAHKLKTRLTEEEKLYMILHVNRICTREGL